MEVAVGALGDRPGAEDLAVRAAWGELRREAGVAASNATARAQVGAACTG